MRIKELAAIFAIDVAAYAVMSNHYHVVAHIARPRALSWSRDAVLTRWTQLFCGPVLVRRYLSPARIAMDTAEIAKVEEIAERYRARLHDLSWFMRVLNESLARQANAEDECTGRFWEGRFKSQALLDEQALLAAMAYVDLNPVRAGMAATPEGSDYTSIQARLGSAPVTRARLGDVPEVPLPQAPLMPFDAAGRTAWAIPFAYVDYLELVDWTGRALHPKKKGSIAGYQPKILERIGVDGSALIAFSTSLLKEFGSAVGTPAALIDLCARRQIKYLRGIDVARRMFGRQEALRAA
ncbi:MAG: transposase [Polaromonas sp.]|nr:transposase [Polaromonas sp.]